jgi:hypothetical protein
MEDKQPVFRKKEKKERDQRKTSCAKTIPEAWF